MSNIISRAYIHVPFCRRKCGYCAFHSIPYPTDSIVNRYLDKLEKDISSSAPCTSGLKSIYIGGGTPSYLSEDNLERLFAIISRYFKSSLNTEFSIECNPDTLTEHKIRMISENVNRVSLGIQTLNSSHQKTIGRVTDLSSLDNIVTSFIGQGVTNLSCDLIFGIPGQSRRSLRKDIERILRFPFKHISTYFLTFEEGSVLSSSYSKNDIADFENEMSYMLMALPEMLSEAGFERYEISNYARQGHECMHNYAIWYGDAYSGFGPAAASFDGKVRSCGKKLGEWLDGVGPDIDDIPLFERSKEIFIMGLRTLKGWTARTESSGTRVCSHLGNELEFTCPQWETILKSLDELSERKMIEMIPCPASKSVRISPTPEGLLFWNEIGVSLI